MADSTPRPCLYVLAGANGAGKSTVGGAAIRERGADYFNPDEAARRIRRANSRVSEQRANSAAWHEGRRLLEEAIARRLTFAIETTLGGRTMTALFERAAAEGIEVRVWYVALATPELHIARVHSRVARGGHDIPEDTVRRRYERSRINLVRLLPALTELRLFDNSIEADPASGKAPVPLLVMHVRGGRVVSLCDPAKVPDWAKPMVAAAVKLSPGPRRGSPAFRTA